MGLEINSNKENIDKNNTNNVFDIDIECSINRDEASFFIENMFKLNEFDKIYNIFDYTERDFDLNILETEALKDKIVFFYDTNWDFFDEETKKRFISDMVKLIKEGLGIDEDIDIIYFADEPDNCGAYDEKNRCIWINENIFYDPKEVLDTIAHEMKHAYQRYRADKLENSKDAFYKYNFEHYVSPIQDENGHWLNFFEYYDQFIEAEARAFASKVVEMGGYLWMK